MSNQMIAGPYKATYGVTLGTGLGGSDLGVIGPDGFELEFAPRAEEVFGDNLGIGTIQEGIFQGGTYYLNFVLEEYGHPVVKDMINPFGGGSANMGVLGGMGQKYTNMAKYLRLDSIYTNAPVDQNEDTFHFPYAILAPNFDITQALATRLRNIPMRLIILPFHQYTDPVEVTRHYTLNAEIPNITGP